MNRLANVIQDERYKDKVTCGVGQVFVKSAPGTVCAEFYGGADPFGIRFWEIVSAEDEREVIECSFCRAPAAQMENWQYEIQGAACVEHVHLVETTATREQMDTMRRMGRSARDWVCRFASETYAKWESEHGK